MVILKVYLGAQLKLVLVFTAYIDDNEEHTNFYQVVSDGNVWWVFTAAQAP